MTYPIPDVIMNVNSYTSVTYNFFLDAPVGSKLTIESVYKSIKCSELTDILVINAVNSSICSFDTLVKSYNVLSNDLLIQYKSQNPNSISDAFKFSWVIDGES